MTPFFTPTEKCPFCAYNIARVTSWEVREHTEYAVMCLNCGALGPNDLGKSGAIEGWNMRRDEYPWCGRELELVEGDVE